MFNEKHNWRRFHPIKILFYVVFAVAFMFVMSWIVMSLWNYVITDLTGWKPMDYWQAFGLLVLCRILFGGFGRRTHHRKKGKHKSWGGKWWGMTDEERREWKEKWHNMSREEKMEMKRKWKEKCRSRWRDRYNEDRNEDQTTDDLV